MNEITTLLLHLHPLLDLSSFRQLALISEALLVMTGRVTQLSISRWVEKGGSYRTIHRFFQMPKQKSIVLNAGTILHGCNKMLRYKG